jgi:hypothetical protein
LDFLERIKCFDSMRISIAEINNTRVKINIEIDQRRDNFQLIYKFDTNADITENMGGMMGAVASINYSLFAKRIIFDFPTDSVDMEFIREMVGINNREVFINRLCRIRYNFFKSEFLPSQEEINFQNASGDTELVFPKVVNRIAYNRSEGGIPVVTLSGGKESLLTYGLIKEMDPRTVAFFFNESGGHWKAAKYSHEIMKKTENTVKVWSNIDRFYWFMNKRMHILDPKVSFSWADDYPVQLFLFPVYLFSILPLSHKLNIDHILMGNEMDDPTEEPPFMGIKHYFGVYDQSPDFQERFTKYLFQKGLKITLWSALYNVYGSVVENVLVNRYKELYKLQRSCHSCIYKEGNVIPCGKCSKCLGVRLFIEYARGNPRDVFYPSSDKLLEEVEKERMKLDPDELNFLMDGLKSKYYSKGTQVTGIHILLGEQYAGQGMPQSFRQHILNILSEYTDGVWELENNRWVPMIL